MTEFAITNLASAERRIKRRAKVTSHLPKWTTFDAETPETKRLARLAIEHAAAHAFGVPPKAIAQDRRGDTKVSAARQVAMYVAHVSCGLSLTEVGNLFGRDRTTVAHACIKVENRRDDRPFDHALDLLSWAVPAIVARPRHFLASAA